ncbi:DNA polymerase III subunit delta' [Acaricomes phytoseiuli]|uniref:DNA polymerase III subunit delta' n=1 Tax=Acaricomes phytoseiuli TaxID=291968 RepID=UPI002223058F|nr:DNA polymerase III subunit delta' [Acaricomes phytoseiuli]MCW1250618.1 DNA polymerase III subunit delta' [Acaricomes phytoseiuli]
MTAAGVWADIRGQEPVVAQLQQAALATVPGHAWLITGPPGSGRSNAARAFAAALNCEEPDPEARGCGRCRSCLTILAGNHPDVTFVETDKTTISIDEARELVTKAQDRPVSARWRVIIVGDADRMTERTTNVLLKAIEEPPPRTLWILCAPSPADVLVTIRSRCCAVGLRVPPAEAVADLLVQRDGIDPVLALSSARAAQSHIGVARRLARDEAARERRDSIVRLPLRLNRVPEAVRAAGALVELASAEAAASNAERDAAEKEELLRTLGAPEQGTLPPAIRSQLKRLEEDQKRRAKRSVTDGLDRALTDLLSFYRDALLLQFSAGQVTEQQLVNTALRPELEEFARQSTPERNLERLETITEMRRRLLGSNAAPLLAIEAMAVSLV